LVAVGTGGTAMTTHGDTAGEETHVITTAEMATHTHTLRETATTASANPDSLTGLTLETSPATVDNRDVLNSVGSDTAHENMPPWVSLSYIIKL